MSVLTYSAHKEVDTACCDDLCLIGCTLGCKILCVSVKDVDVFLRNVYVIEEVSCHKRVIALRMLLRKAYILIHIESDHVLE